MSMKLNAEEMAAKRYPRPSAIMLDGTKVNHCAAAYAAAIEEVAQPIADERDELREALEAVLSNWDAHLHQPEELKTGDLGDGKTFQYWSPAGAMIDTEPIAKARAILAKRQKKP